eukprot:scaffold2190_cov72-Cylindrotheca_fusiformis.AAC.2
MTMTLTMSGSNNNNKSSTQSNWLSKYWDYQYQKLLQQKQLFNDSQPQNKENNEDPNLQRWMKMQRRFYRHGRLTHLQMERLERIGFFSSHRQQQQQQQQQECPVKKKKSKAAIAIAAKKNKTNNIMATTTTTTTSTATPNSSSLKEAIQHFKQREQEEAKRTKSPTTTTTTTGAMIIIKHQNPQKTEEYDSTIQTEKFLLSPELVAKALEMKSSCTNEKKKIHKKKKKINNNNKWSDNNNNNNKIDQQQQQHHDYSKLKQGSPISIYWDDDDCWYDATILRCIPSTTCSTSPNSSSSTTKKQQQQEPKPKKVIVEYTDGKMTETIDLNKIQWSNTTALSTQLNYKKQQVVQSLTKHARLNIWWGEEEEYYSGTLKYISKKKAKTWQAAPHYIVYDDGDEEWVHLLNRKFHVLP